MSCTELKTTENWMRAAMLAKQAARLAETDEKAEQQAAAERAAKRREYDKRPEVIARRSEYDKRPEVIERRRRYMREYYARRERPEPERQARRAYNREYRARKMATDPDFVAKMWCRKVLKRGLAKAKAPRKSERTAALLGYTPKALRSHIEAQFEDWMSWENHGEWHVDHIIPLAFFIQQGITDPQVIHALSNLRPLRAAENIRKGCRVEAETA